MSSSFNAILNELSAAPTTLGVALFHGINGSCLGTRGALTASVGGVALGTVQVAKEREGIDGSGTVTVGLAHADGKLLVMQKGKLVLAILRAPDRS